MVTQVKEFSEYGESNLDLVNAFLKNIGKQCISVTPIYNNILGQMQYVVIYNTIVE